MHARILALVAGVSFIAVASVRAITAEPPRPYPRVKTTTLSTCAVFGNKSNPLISPRS
jgi:hypothetical protein